jgi:tetratricopeptide (TPR) repeat protein
MQGSGSGCRALRVTACGVVAIAATLEGIRAEDPAPAAAGRPALDYAFRFATGVRDAKDRAKAQESALNGTIDAGLLEEAERRAAEIEGWRRGAVLGRIAALHVRAGNIERARELLAEVERAASEARDWGRDRVLAQVAEVRALLGETDRAREIGGQLISSDPRTYEGRATVAMAWALAAGGDLEGAERTMATLDDSVDVYVTWWRTEGYLELAGRGGIDAVARAELLAKARASAAGIDGWKQAEMLQEIAEAQRDAGRGAEAVASLEAAERILVAQPRTMSLRGPLLADLARSWGGLGRRERALGLLATAEGDLEHVASIVELPAATARVGTGYAALGRIDDARRLLRLALDRAAALENPRPRALALSAVCRETGRRGLALEDDLRTRLDGLLGGLGGVSSRAGL